MIADAHLAHQREREALGEDERQHDQQQRVAAPDEPAAEVERPVAQRAIVRSQSARVPMRPFGRKISISTISR